MEKLLSTKLYIPSTRPQLVSRPRLIEQLNHGLYRKLTLISAPAGFGKTTLISEWVERLNSADQKDRRTDYNIGWLSIDKGDNDRVQFLAYIIAALNQIDRLAPSFGRATISMLRSQQPPPNETILNSLINEIDAISTKLLLVLDDYHLIETQSIHDALAYLIEHQPPHLHLVIISREDPPLALTRLRASDQLTSLRATDLRFTSSEASEFLNNVMGLDLSLGEIRKLETRTEGWVTGLQLAAISMQGSEDASLFINSFTGSHHLILDYLIEEVLDHQSTNVQTFLLSTAVLNRLTASLCDAVSDQEESQKTLETLERANLFIIPLDNERNWYRYHHLFQDLLRQRLDRTHRAKGADLHRRAAVWWDENGYIDQAIEHALYSGDPEWAASMLESHIDELWHGGKGMVVRRWINRLPIEIVNTKPMLCIMRGYFLHGGGEQEEAERSLLLAEELINSGEYLPGSTQETRSPSSIDASVLLGKLATIRGLMHSFWGEIPETMQYTGQALEYLPPSELGWSALAAISRSEIHAFLCDTEAAREAQSDAVEACKAAGNDYFVMIASLRLAGTLKEQGYLHEALEICKQQLRVADERGLSESSTAGSLYLLLAEVLAQTGEINTALDNAYKGMTLDERSEYLPVRRCWSYLTFMKVLLSHSDFSGIEGKIQKMRALAPKSESLAWIGSMAEAWQARVWLAQGRLELAAMWLEIRGLETDCDSPDFGIFCLLEDIVVARVLIAQGRMKEAGELLTRLDGFTQKNGLVAKEIEILALCALAHEAEGNSTEALAVLERALILAEPGGFIRVFVDEGQPMAHLLYEILSRAEALKLEIGPDYVQQLLAAFLFAEEEHTERKKSQPHDSVLIEPLSEREIEILYHIADGLTNPEIATKLTLSHHTVKAHTRNIYGKLDAHNRTEAVARARALGVLPAI
jgi:LuxR family maltose regulon positive regulatory protein